jgi:heme-degrading monooxygenase HmoA
MFVLFVDMKIKPGSEQSLEKTFLENFQPVISQQEGFCAVALLRPNKGGGEYRLSIAFESHELQKKWVANDLHQVVWPQLETHTTDYSVNHYTSV